MLRDREGFMWFGTQDGLNLYDGKKFRVFQNQPDDTNSISNNYIVSLCEDEEGFLWIGTMTGGLNRLNKQNEKIKVFLHSEDKNSISENTVWSLLAPGDGSIWAGTSMGLNKYDKRTRQFRTFVHNPIDRTSISADMIVSLFKDSRHRIWVGTVDGLCLLNNSADNFIQFRNPSEKEWPGANIIWSISETTSGEIITGTNNGVYVLDDRTGHYSRIFESKGKRNLVAWSVGSEKTGVIWAGTDQGLYRMTANKQEVQIFLNDPAKPQSIADNNIWCMLSDSSGFLWIGTKNGISKLKISTPQFQLLSHETGDSIKLSSSNVMAILEDKLGYLWIGTDGGGLNCINPRKDKIKVYNSANSGLYNDAVWALAEDKEGNIWIGNYQGGLHVFNRSSGKIKAFPQKQNDPHALSNNRILALLPDSDGSIWIGTRGGGLINFNPVSNLFKSYQHSPDDSTTISGNTVLSLAFDNKNRLWVGIHDGGLNLLLSETGKFKSFRKKTGDHTSLSDNNVWAILFDKKNRLWLGTDGGLNYSEEPGENMKFKYLNTRDGLKSNIIFGLEEDQHGNIWMSNFNGLSKLEIKTLESIKPGDIKNDDFPGFYPLFRVFDSDQGLQGAEFNQGAYHKGHTGLLYFGGTKGLNFFSPADVKESKYIPPVIITGFKIFNKEVDIIPAKDESGKDRVTIVRTNTNYSLPVSIRYIRELILTYRESVISFDFASLDFSNPQKNQYAYKMLNFDENWNFVGNQNSATYTNLNAGSYSLLIRGTNADGIWAPDETVLKIEIVPPFWKTTWFILLLILVIVLTGFLIVRRLFLIQKEKAQKEKELIELKLKTIKSQINPHFAFNALNTIASFIYSEEPDVAYDYFTRFALMIRNILNDNDKILSSLREELDFVKNYLELQKIRLKDKFDYFIQVEDTISLETQIPKMIIQSYAENAVKHGLMHRVKNGRLNISVKGEDSGIQIIVEDNGIGRAKASELSTNSTHKGLKIIEQIIELYQRLYHTNIVQEIEDLTDENGNSTGTKVVLTLSLIRLSGKKRIFSLSGNKINRYGY